MAKWKSFTAYTSDADTLFNRRGIGTFSSKRLLNSYNAYCLSLNWSCNACCSFLHLLVLLVWCTCYRCATPGGRKPMLCADRWWTCATFSCDPSALIIFFFLALVLFLLFFCVLARTLLLFYSFPLLQQSFLWSELFTVDIFLWRNNVST